MSLQKVIKHFDVDYQLPRNPERIRDYILESNIGCADEIEFYAEDLEEGNINGFYVLVKYEHPIYGELKKAIIVVNRMSPPYWRRFSAIKELIHVFDKEDYRYADREVHKLLKEMEFPYDVISAGMYENDPDARAVIPALALCVPTGIRKEMQAKLMAASKTESIVMKERFCKKFEIPFRYKNLVFDEGFDELLRKVLNEFY